MSRRFLKMLLDVVFITIGSAMFALAFSIFLEPNALNCGGLSGAAMVFCTTTGIGSVGTVCLLLNVPLFAISCKKLGKKFFFGSLYGMILSNVLIDVFALLPAPQLEPLIAALYGGLISGAGIGLVFLRGASTGGADIIIRLIKRRHRSFTMGKLAMLFDFIVIVATGLVFRDLNTILYCCIVLYTSSIAMDGVIYGLEFSKVVLIISDRYEEIVAGIDTRLDRGATYLKGEGSYQHADKMVVLCAIKKNQLGELRDIVIDIDPNAFVIVQEAHQVLGFGFDSYSKDSL